MKFKLKIIQINQENLGIAGVILLALQYLSNRKKNELIYIESENISYSNKHNIWNKFFKQPFKEYDDLIKKNIENKNYILEKAVLNKNYLFNWVGKNINFIKKSKLISPYRKVFNHFIKFNDTINTKFTKIEKEYFKKKILSIHLRGTDRFYGGHFDNQRKKFKFSNIEKILQKKMIEFDTKKIYLATDDLEYKRLMLRSFKKNTIFSNSTVYGKKDGHGIHGNFYETENFKTKIAEEAILDMMLMARSDYSLYCSSNVSLVSILMKKDNKYNFIDDNLKSE